MKTALLYSSNYGSTKQYAIWINEKISCDIFDINTINEETFFEYDQFIIVSSVLHNQLSAYKFIKKYNKFLSNKKITIVSSSINQSDEVERKTRALFASDITFYHVPGSFKSNLSLKHHLGMIFHYRYYAHNSILTHILHYGRPYLSKKNVINII